VYLMAAELILFVEKRRELVNNANK
jgi:hypothetical protein